MINPVIRKEIKASVRTWRIFGAITAYVAIMLIICAVYLSAGNYYFDPRTSIYLFTILSGFQLFFVMLIVPSLSGSAVSGERERQTLDLLLVTKMRPISIIFGKLASSLLVVLLLIAASMPVYGILLFYGGFSVLNIFGMILFTMLTAAMGGSVAIFFSTFTKRTIVSTVLCYIIFIFITVGNIIIFYVISSVLSTTLNTPIPDALIHVFGMLNPFTSFLSVCDTQFGTTMSYDIMRGFNYYGYYNYNQIFANVFVNIPIWVYNCVINAAAIVFFNVLSAFVINPSNRRK